MFHRLLEHVNDCQPDELRDLCIQDAAICTAWLQSYPPGSEERAAFPNLPANVERWLADIPVADEQTEGRRHQTVLRAQADVLVGGKVDLLQRDEVDFLIAVCDLAGRAARPEVFRRIHDLIEPHVSVLRMHQATTKALPGLPTLSALYHVVTPEDIKNAKAREIKVFAGIAMPAQGPVLALSGHVKVLGSVPENCIVVIEDGACVIEGYVMGRVAAKGSCEVRENISGVVVTRKGDIRCRSIVNNAFVVSKLGSVFCLSALQPRLIFSGVQIRISTTALMGRYISPRVQVVEHAFGGEYQVSEFLIANNFRRSDARPLSIVLRREISGEDYGEQPSDSAERLMARGARLRERITTLDELIQSIERELEHYASGALMYICGGETTKDRIQTIQAAERRLSVLDRIVAGLHVLSRNAQESLNTLSRSAVPANGGRPCESEAKSFFQDLDTEMKALEQEGEIDPDLANEKSSLIETHVEMEAREPDRRVTSLLLTRLRDKEAGWISEREKLLNRISALENEVQEVLESAQVIERTFEKDTKVQTLMRVLAALKSRPSTDIFVTRAQSAFVRLMTRSIGTRVERLKNSRMAAASARSEYQTIVNELQASFLVPWGTQNARPGHATRVTGRFEHGVRILSDPFLLTEDNAPDRFAVLTPESRAGEAMTYKRGEDGTIDIA
ncbi:MAG: hypothetical protein HZB26_16705 [Candidatus Hydrogenedentes bacterium]|nr:hypothetical protein [Candidatus Hydrogenedentota bacterium]